MGHLTWSPSAIILAIGSVWSPRLVLLPNEFDPPQLRLTGRPGRPVTVIPVIVVNGVWLVKKSSGVLSSIDERKNVCRHLGGIFLCAHERIPRGLGRFSFSKAWRAVSGGEARKLLRSALPTNIRFNGRHFGAQQVVKSTERNI